MELRPPISWSGVTFEDVAVQYLARLCEEYATAQSAGQHTPELSYRPALDAFFRHVAFDQLVTPRTVYIDRATIVRWLRHGSIEPGSTYVLMRNGNSWKFGGVSGVRGQTT